MKLENYQSFHDYGLPYNLTNTEDNPSNLTQAERMMKNIEYLYKKMELCTRNITYFDLYKFTTIITESSKFQSQINNLEPYTSAIINTSISLADGIVYNPGDIVVKNNDGSTETIRAQRGGIFYPSIIKKEDGQNNYTYNFTFAYQSAPPSEKEKKATVSGNEWSGIYAKDMIFEGLAGKSVGSPYNAVFTSFDSPFDETIDAAYDTANNPIPPIVYYYTNISSQAEEIYVDQTIEYNSKTKKYEISSVINNTLCKQVVVK